MHEMLDYTTMVSDFTDLDSMFQKLQNAVSLISDNKSLCCI